MSTSNKVLLTGASGFVALRILEYLLIDPEDYKVIGTVRSQSKADFIIKNMKIIHPELDFSGDKLTFEFVSDVAVPGAFDSVLKNHQDINFVLHTASPFTGAVEDPQKELVDPAVNGTTEILKAAKKYGPNIKHFVVTSSFAAVANPLLMFNPDTTFKEDTWNPLTLEQAIAFPASDKIFCYFVSKALAERAAWDFIEKEKPSFTFNTINPGYIWGPHVFNSTVENKSLNESTRLFDEYLNVDLNNTSPLDGPMGPFLIFADGRDVAKLHLAAIKRPEIANGNRWLGVSGYTPAQDLVDYLHKTFPEFASKHIGLGLPGSGKESLTRVAGYDASKTIEQSGVEFTAAEKTLYDTAKQLIDYRYRGNDEL